MDYNDSLLNLLTYINNMTNMDNKIFVNFNLKYNDEKYYFIGKEVLSSTLSEFIFNTSADFQISRHVSKELDIVIIIYNADDKKQIELKLLNI